MVGAAEAAVVAAYCLASQSGDIDTMWDARCATTQTKIASEAFVTGKIVITHSPNAEGKNGEVVEMKTTKPIETIVQQTMINPMI